MMRVQVITVDMVHQYWEYVEPFLKSALEVDQFPEYTIDQVKVLIVKEHQKLLVVTDDDDIIHGAMTVEFINYPNCRVAFVTLAGGRLIASQENWEQISEWMRDNGATKCRGVVPESVARFWGRLGFQGRNIIVETEL